MFVGGSDKLGAAKFGEAGAVILECDLPKFQYQNTTGDMDRKDEFKAIVENNS